MSTYSKQAIKIQGLQIADAFLVWCGFALAFALRVPILTAVYQLLSKAGRPLLIDSVAYGHCSLHSLDIGDDGFLSEPHRNIELAGVWAHCDDSHCDGLCDGVVIAVFKNQHVGSVGVDTRAGIHHLFADAEVPVDAFVLAPSQQA